MATEAPAVSNVMGVVATSVPNLGNGESASAAFGVVVAGYDA